LTIGATFLFAVATLVIIFTGVAGFGISELARNALRTGVAPGRGQVTREKMPEQFSRSVTLCFIIGNVLFIACAAAAVGVGLMLYRSMQ
jgi:hypothetical protein